MFVKSSENIALPASSHLKGIETYLDSALSDLYVRLTAPSRVKGIETNTHRY